MVRLICKELSRPIIIVSHMSQPLNENFKYKLQTRTPTISAFRNKLSFLQIGPAYVPAL